MTMSLRKSVAAHNGSRIFFLGRQWRYPSGHYCDRPSRKSFYQQLAQIYLTEFFCNVAVHQSVDTPIFLQLLTLFRVWKKWIVVQIFFGGKVVSSKYYPDKITNCQERYEQKYYRRRSLLRHHCLNLFWFLGRRLTRWF